MFSELRGLGIQKKQYCKNLQDMVSWVEQHNEDSEGSESPKRARNYGSLLDPENDLTPFEKHALYLDLELPLKPPMSISFAGHK